LIGMSFVGQEYCNESNNNGCNNTKEKSVKNCKLCQQKSWTNQHPRAARIGDASMA